MRKLLGTLTVAVIVAIAVTSICGIIDNVENSMYSTQATKNIEMVNEIL